VRRGLASRGIPIALSSYRYPSLHREFPWRAFLEQCDLNMPQVYWEQSHDPVDQLRRCVREFITLAPVRPVMPVAPTYKTNGWSPTAADVRAFLDAAYEANKQAVSFFSWDECRRDLPTLWDVVAAEIRWPATTAPEPQPQPGPDRSDGTAVTLLATALVDGQNTRSGPSITEGITGQLRVGQTYPILDMRVLSPGSVWAMIGPGWAAVVYGGKKYMEIKKGV
jgi:hypothetical protein